MPTRSFRLPAAPDGQSSVVHCWQGGQPATGVMILAHGMGEHALRYRPLAEALVAAGFDVYANDHRGHGQTVRDASQLGDFGPDGWRGLVDDALALTRRLREEVDVPILIMGHSMGSLLVQHLLTEASELFAGAALSGTTAADVMAAATQAASDGADGDFDLFASFNAAFEPVRTASDWLSRDPVQVDLYVDDPLCGFSVTADSLATLMASGVAFSTAEASGRIRRDLPIYLFAGDKDPVGLGGVLVTKVADRYREAGVADVALKLYPEARHEVFNETNRAEVVRDFVAWARRVRDAAGSRSQTK